MIELARVAVRKGVVLLSTVYAYTALGTVPSFEKKGREISRDEGDFPSTRDVVLFSTVYAYTALGTLPSFRKKSRGILKKLSHFKSLH